MGDVALRGGAGTVGHRWLRVVTWFIFFSAEVTRDQLLLLKQNVSD